MSDLIKPELEVIRERMQRATPGPWGWFGNTSVHHVYLATQRWGRHIVMDFARWGMQQAQPVFFDRPAPADVRKSIVADSTLRAAADVPVYEVAPHARHKSDPAVYREDLVGLRNADAAFIAHSRADVEWLVGEVDRLNGIIAAGTATLDGQSLRLVGWRCEHRWNSETDGEHFDWDHRKEKLVKAPNVVGSSYMIGPWGHDAPERRCPHATPVYAVVDAEAVSA